MSSQSEALGGVSRPLEQEQQQQDDDTDLALRPVGFASSAASSIESAVPDWINPRPDKDNVIEDNDDVVNVEEEWAGEAPVRSTGNFRYDQRGGGVDGIGPRTSSFLQQPPSPYNTNINNNRMMQLSQEDLETLRGSYYNNDGGVVTAGRRNKGDKLKRMYLAKKLREQVTLPVALKRSTKSNYLVPADSNIIRGKLLTTEAGVVRKSYFETPFLIAKHSFYLFGLYLVCRKLWQAKPKVYC